MASGKVDLELKKAFKDLQDQMKSTAQKLKFKDLQIAAMTSQKQEQEGVAEELAKLTEDTIVYESVGRCFFLSDVPTSKKHIVEEIKTYSDKIKTYKDSKVYLEKSLTESENNLRELVAQKRVVKS